MIAFVWLPARASYDALAETASEPELESATVDAVT